MSRVGPLRGLWPRGIHTSELLKGSSFMPQQQALHLSSSFTLRTVRFISEHRMSGRAETNGRTGRRFETSFMPRKQPLPGNSHRIARSNLSPNCSKQFEAGAQLKDSVTRQTVWRSPDGGAEILLNYNCTQKSYGKSGRRGELAYKVGEQGRSSHNRARPALKRTPTPVARSFVTQTSGMAEYHNTSLQLVQQDFDAFRDQSRFQKAAELRRGKTQEPKYRQGGEVFSSFRGQRGYANNVAQLEAQSPQLAKWKEVAMMMRNPAHEVVGGIEHSEKNTGSLKMELERGGDLKLNLSKSIRASDALQIREPEPLCKEEGESSAIFEERVSKNFARQDPASDNLLRNAMRMDGRSTPAWIKARLDWIAQGRLQSRSSFGLRDWSGDTQGNGSMHKPYAGTSTEALAVLKKKLLRGTTVDSYIYLNVLRRCSKQKDLITAKQVHHYIIQNRMDKNPYVVSSLLDVYIKCGQLLVARRFFNEVEKKDVPTWNMMIVGYAKSNQPESALELFKLMSQEGVQPNEITYLCILKACASASALKWGEEVHMCIRSAGFESDVRVATALVQMYMKCGCLTEARQVFDKMEERNSITWNTMIGGLAQDGSGHEAYILYRQMRREGVNPDAYTYANIFNASPSAGDLEWVKEVHGHASKAGLDSDLRVSCALVHIYAKSGSIDDARNVFDRMERRDVITWTIMIGALAHDGRGHEAYRLYTQMRLEGFKPDAFTYASILNASASAGALEWVKEVHGHAWKAGLESDLRVGNALVHMYAESGSIEDARLMFDRMKKRDLVTWNTMIDGLAHHGCGHEALELFRKMNVAGVKPDAISFVAVLSACSHAGLLDEGCRLFSAMVQDYDIEPDLVHYTCMVDLLGRAGRLEEAKQVITEMPLEPDAVIWMALLGACRTYNDVELAKFAANEVFKVETNDAPTYVLLSNIYAAAGNWEKVSSVRDMMKERGVRKETGRSWIEVDNKIHDFVAGNKSHPEANAIYSYLKELTEKLKAEGYIPDTQLVLQNIDEEDKELALCSHSEKLAIAYGLMRIPGDKAIRVYKNLRVCPDCHTATKLISKVTGREIIARDANRFHHFKDGVCSCGDYW